MGILIDGMGGDHAHSEIVKRCDSGGREIDDTLIIIGAEDLISRTRCSRNGMEVT